jgi:hypothetical protein
LTKLFSLLALTTCHVAIMIATKNGAMTTATTVMTTRQKARGPDNFVTTDQILRPKISALLVFYLFLA